MAKNCFLSICIGHDAGSKIVSPFSVKNRHWRPHDNKHILMDILLILTFQSLLKIADQLSKLEDLEDK